MSADASGFRRNASTLVPAKDYDVKFSSKLDCYRYLVNHCKYLISDMSSMNIEQMYLDEIQYVNRDYLKQLFNEDKAAFFQKDIQTVSMPNWPELKIENVIAIIKDDPDMQKYFKDKYWELKKPHSKPFILNIVNTVLPGLLQGLMVECSNERNTTTGDEKEKQAIKMT